MKKIFLIFSLFLSVFMHGQIGKGAWLVGPSFNYSRSETTNGANPSANSLSVKNSNFNSELRLGYFVTDKIVVGLIGGYNSSSNIVVSNGGNPNYQKITTTSGVPAFGLFGRVYKLFNENKYGFFCQLNAQYQTGKNKTINEIIETGGSLQTTETGGNISGANVGLRPGIVFFITQRIGLETSFGSISYNRQVTQNTSAGQNTSKNTSNGLNINFGLNTIYLGVNFYFGRKKV